MKRVGELYEVVVFTASVSKVRSHDYPLKFNSYWDYSLVRWSSTRPIRYPQCGSPSSVQRQLLQSPRQLCQGQCFDKSLYCKPIKWFLTPHRTFHKLAATFAKLSSLTIRLHRIYSILNTRYLSAAGSPMLTTTNYWTSSRFSKILPVLKYKMWVWCLMLHYKVRIRFQFRSPFERNFAFLFIRLWIIHTLLEHWHCIDYSSPFRC